MANDEIEREEVDRLVEALKHPPKVTRPVVVPVGAAVHAQQQPQTPEPEYRATVPGRPFSNATLLMPEITTRQPKRHFAFASSIGGLSLQRLSLPRFSLHAITEAEWGVITVRMFIGLGLALSAAMMFWPYENACGWGLYLYLAAVLLVVVTGVWGAKLAWDMELGAAHTLAICIIFWGLTLIAAEVLPRVGYAQVQQPWFCA